MRVANLAFKKVVQVCYTLSDWKNQKYLNLIWEGNCEEDTDKFIVVIPVPIQWSGKVEFATRYEVNGNVYWDNCYQDNYKVPVNGTLRDNKFDLLRRLPALGDRLGNLTPSKIEAVKYQGVVVKHYELSNEKPAVIGTVLVANLAFKKRVNVYYTLNGWKDHNILDLIWEGSIGKLGEIDVFGIVVPLVAKFRGRFEFAIRYEVNGLVFWDNNNLQYYKKDI